MSQVIPYNPGLLTKAKALRRDMPEPERVMWYQILRVGGLARYPWKRQQPLLEYIVDFYCPRLRIAIELVGDTHFTPNQEAYDLERTGKLEKYGVTVIRYANNEVCTNSEGVFVDLLSRIEEREKARE